MGVVFAWVGFRLYAPPVARSGGWSWGARGRKRAFFKGVGEPSNVGGDHWGVEEAEPEVEMETAGTLRNGDGHAVDLESGRRRDLDE